MKTKDFWALCPIILILFTVLTFVSKVVPFTVQVWLLMASGIALLSYLYVRFWERRKEHIDDTTKHRVIFGETILGYSCTRLYDANGVKVYETYLRDGELRKSKAFYNGKPTIIQYYYPNGKVRLRKTILKGQKAEVVRFNNQGEKLK